MNQLFPIVPWPPEKCAPVLEDMFPLLRNIETHYGLIPPDTEYMWSYLESRGVSDKGVAPFTLAYGPQMGIKAYIEW